MLLDQFGRPLEPTTESLNVFDHGWSSVTNFDTGDAATDSAFRWAHGLDRGRVQELSRAAYLSNTVLYGALDTLHGLVLGDGVSYGEMADDRAYDAMEDFYQVNDLASKMGRWWIEFMIDGENLTVFPTRVKPTEAARVGFVDVSRGLTLGTEDGIPDYVTSVELGMDRRTLREGEFVWTANEALWNDPRGWPGVMRAIPPALAYVRFLNSRQRVHELAGRINAVYKAFAASAVELEAKSKRYQNVPRDGRVLTLHKNKDGLSEDFDLLTTNTNARDAEADGRSLMRLVGLALNLPDHYLGMGDTGNRATADAMSAPIIASVSRRQNTVKDYLNRVMRIELERRYGPEQLYKIMRTRTRDGGKTRVTDERMVPASALEFPWSLPTLQSEDLDGLVKKVEVASRLRLASRQTLSGNLGYDWAAELENMSAEGADTNPEPDPDPEPPGGDPDEQENE